MSIASLTCWPVGLVAVGLVAVGLVAVTIVAEQPTIVVEPTIAAIITKLVIAAVIVEPVIIIELEAAITIATTAIVFMTTMAIVISSPELPKISYFRFIFSFHSPYFFENLVISVIEY